MELLPTNFIHYLLEWILNSRIHIMDFSILSLQHYCRPVSSTCVDMVCKFYWFDVVRYDCSMTLYEDLFEQEHFIFVAKLFEQELFNFISKLFEKEHFNFISKLFEKEHVIFMTGHFHEEASSHRSIFTNMHRYGKHWYYFHVIVVRVQVNCSSPFLNLIWSFFDSYFNSLVSPNIRVLLRFDLNTQRPPQFFISSYTCQEM